MKSPSYLYKETLSKNGQVPVQKTDRVPGWKRGAFGMGPEDFWKAKGFRLSDKVVFVGLAINARGTGVAKVSHGALAEGCGAARTTVLESLRRLEKGGLIERLGEPVDQVQGFRLLHPAVTGRKVERLVAEMAPGEKVRCPECQKERKGLLKVGWCRSCQHEKKVRGWAREEADGRIEARMVSMEEGAA